MLLLEALLVARAQLVHGRQVHLVERGEHRRRGLRLHQALGDARAQARHRHAMLAASRDAARWPRSRQRPPAHCPAPCGARCASTSPLVMRPSRPLPGIAPASSLCSSTRRRTDGASLSLPAALGGAASSFAAGAGRGSCLRLRPPSPARRPPPAAPSSSSASTWPLVTVGAVLHHEFLDHARPPAPAPRAPPCRSRDRRGSRRGSRHRPAACARRPAWRRRPTRAAGERVLRWS